jgi:hypothetical protein
VHRIAGRACEILINGEAALRFFEAPSAYLVGINPLLLACRQDIPSRFNTGLIPCKLINTLTLAHNLSGIVRFPFLLSRQVV